MSAALCAALLSACAGADPTAAPDVAAPTTATASVASAPFFTAWSNTFVDQPIQSQLRFAPDTRQYRQHAGLTASRALLDFARANPGKLYFNGDEPDQHCTDPAEYAVTYHKFVLAIRAADSTAKVSPAGFAEPNRYCCPDPPGDCFERMHSIGYAQQFYDAYVQRYGKAPAVDEWRFHDFGLNFRGNIDAWWQRVSRAAAWSRRHGANMVLGGWGFINWVEPDSVFEPKLHRAMDLLRNDPRINQAVWWSYEDLGSLNFLRNSDGSLTPEGRRYAQPPAVMSLVLGVEKFTNETQRCIWGVTVSGGVPPYSYRWFVDDRVAGANAPTFADSVGRSFTLRVRATDRFGVVKRASRRVEVGAQQSC